LIYISEVTPNLVPWGWKKKTLKMSKNLFSTRDTVAKLFIGHLGNRFALGQHVKQGGIIASLLTEFALATDGSTAAYIP
jgi:hypothetical protein